MPLAAWTVVESEPVRLQASAVDLEKNLETWIAGDPSLVDRGFVVLERQLNLPGSGRLDLLCVDQQGRLAVVEIKRGTLIRETIAQALDYASVVASWSGETIRSKVPEALLQKYPDHPGLQALVSLDDSEPPEVVIIVVGCGADAGIERMIQFLGERCAVPIRAVTFEVFRLPTGEQVIVREETEPELPTGGVPTSRYSVASVIEKAGGLESSTGRRMMKLVEAAERGGLYPRPYKVSIMFAPQQMKTRYLATAWRPTNTQLVLTYSSDAFAEFFPIDAASVSTILGPERVDITTDEQLDVLVARFEELFAEIAQRQEGSDGHEEEG